MYISGELGRSMSIAKKGIDFDYILSKAVLLVVTRIYSCSSRDDD